MTAPCCFGPALQDREAIGGNVFPVKVTGLPGMRETGVKAGGSNWRTSRFRKPESTHWGKDGLCLPHIKRNTEKRTAHRQGRNASLPVRCLRTDHTCAAGQSRGTAAKLCLEHHVPQKLPAVDGRGAGVVDLRGSEGGIRAIARRGPPAGSG